ncbi:MAG TPA: hypothetical protein PKN75_12580 [Bacteroidia bacterium]|nr:hypothetical protein [Bacteroidia bacterium]HNU34414.1 hypothetical protein [Bacteroidia bacterium]
MKVHLVNQLLILVYLSGTTLHLKAQVNKTENGFIYVTNANEKLKFEVTAKIPTGKLFKPELTYYWYSYNQVHQTTGGADGKLLHGEFSSYFSDNNIKEKGNFRFGLKHGTWKEWDTKGLIKKVAHYKHGKLHGVQTEYDVDAVPKKTTFVNGKIKIPKPKGNVPNEKKK